jgi:Abnormal spindle-like microcephaly-assoc'd, ASPM-SPD-2-Hydin
MFEPANETPRPGGTRRWSLTAWHTLPCIALAALSAGCATTSQGWLAASEWLVAAPPEVELVSPDGASISMAVVLTNTGPDSIYASIEVTPEAFTADQTWVSIKPAESSVVNVKFRPGDDGPQDGVLTLILDGSTRKEIPLHGE